MDGFEVEMDQAARLYVAGRFEEAATLSRELVSAFPGDAQALNLAAISSMALGDLGGAEDYLQRAIAARPGFSPALNNFGLVLDQRGRLGEAADIFLLALEADPKSLEAANNLAYAYIRLGRLREAEEILRNVLATWPKYAPALLNLANLLISIGELTEAEHFTNELIAVDPNNPNAHLNAGRVYSDSGRFEAAEAAFNNALSRDPGYVGAYNNLGLLFHRLGRFEEAEAAYQRALAIDPAHVLVMNNLANLHLERKQFDAAAALYRAAVAHKPDFGHAIGKWLLSAREVCDWASGDAAERAVVGLTQAEEIVEDLGPFETLIVPSLSGQDHRQIALAYGNAVHRFALERAPMVETSSIFSRTDGRRLRIGYLSSDFHEHATTQLLAGVLDAHDSERFSVFCYSTGRPIVDSARARVIAACGKFVDLHFVSDFAAAQQIAEDEIDILVDLKGYTENGRLSIQAFRPAPLIVSWLGYPGTLGVPRLADYIIGDPIVTPLEKRCDYSETLALLPHCYQPNDRNRNIGAKPSRSEVSLPEEGFVFCNFNRSYKILPATFQLWLRILDAVPGSVLWLLDPGPAAAARLRIEAERGGVSGERVIFARPLSVSNHLARLQLADLALDTFPYVSHTTASDALWAGTPLVTKMGDSFASRVAASLLFNAGLPDLVVADDEAYFELTCALAHDRERLDGLRQRLIEGRLTCPLFDSKRFARNLERLYAAIWEQERRGVREPVLVIDGTS